MAGQSPAGVDTGEGRTVPANEQMKVAIAGGGTAGHVNPAIALAHAMPGHDVCFLGTSAGAESVLVPPTGHALFSIDVRGFDRSRPLTIFPVATRALRAVGQAGRALDQWRAQVVVGMGGYVSLPACLAARRRGLPVVLHEQNAVLGLANRVCKPLARIVAVSFEETLAQTGKKGVLVGNPVLPQIAEADLDAERRNALQRWDLDSGRVTLLVFGGSQGARRINEAASGLARLWGSRSDRQIVHVTGREHVDAVRDAVAAATPADLIYRVVPFVDEMAQAYAVADLALCRGGATTVAELGVIGLPAIIVPYPWHRDRQQELHGGALARAGAAVVVPDAETSADRIAAEADALLSDRPRLEAMRTAAASFGRPEAAAKLAGIVEEIAG
jgi:UDP-N-acetylglucosamine--N-acetylmuramyl-(pentapeptide) pyrophosphoryl-undecaprenol N-acetylglucosamine transferase